jgi:hypothetical protein
VRSALLAVLIVAATSGCVSLPLCSDVGVSYVTRDSPSVKPDATGRYIHCPRGATGHCLEGGMSCVVE